MSDETKFDIDADLFLRVRRATDVSSTRYCITGVLVDPVSDGGAWLVATDGQALVVARDHSATAPRRAVISLTMPEVPPPDAADCDYEGCCMIPSDFMHCRIIFDPEPGGRAVAEFRRADHGWKHAIAADLDCADRFPDWRKVWRGRTPAEMPKRHVGYGISAGLLNRIFPGDFLSIRSLGDGLPSTVSIAGQPAIAALVMPSSNHDAGGALLIEELRGNPNDTD
jgi:hypothetical protein